MPQLKFVPNFLLRELVGWYLALAVLAALAAFWPWELGVKADPFAPVPPGIRPEWYFLAAFQTLKLLPAHVAGIEGELVGVVGMGWRRWRWCCCHFSTGGRRRGEPSPVVTALGVVALVYLVVFTVVGYVLA